jgi:hypothetical protein
MRSGLHDRSRRRRSRATAQLSRAQLLAGGRQHSFRHGSPTRQCVRQGPQRPTREGRQRSRPSIPIRLGAGYPIDSLKGKRFRSALYTAHLGAATNHIR